ncbi:SHOCT domain-containing protein [Streptomyces roseicoloratus]|uniref:SHOCT domain-containing protein n=1 Tax=Streptomyces roseicoloratus TaxID=2508722 RepID=A0ABY9S2Q6_9ACTN|nr:SHOCT domain-containing protein [Streptomyces roseicoloratus]WMX48708.1 SHOCT domain-containing protein [Streptomyces roseicoloratus]
MFWTIMWVFLWILWFMLLFRIIGDIFRDDAMNGWGKAGWTAFVVLLPFLGCFVYLIARGKGMGRRELQRARANEQEFQEYIRAAATATGTPPGGTGHADQLAKLADLKDHGHITAEEYARAKERILAG